MQIISAWQENDLFSLPHQIYLLILFDEDSHTLHMSGYLLSKRTEQSTRRLHYTQNKPLLHIFYTLSFLLLWPNILNLLFLAFVSVFI